MTLRSCPTCGSELSRNASSAGLCASCLLATALLADNEGQPDVESPATLAPGATVGPFRIVRLLGRGGMAAVYEAHEPSLDRAVALKLLPPQYLHDEAFARRFDQEARVVARLEHPHIVPIYASGIEEGTPWMSMRLLTGGTVGALVERRPAAADAIRMLRDAALALDYAHAHGVVHRDIKPTNLLLDSSGRVSVGDFGLAQILGGTAALTRAGTFAGTPHYMAPEQALGKPTDHRCDIYSLGIVTYELLVGEAPFIADSPVAVLFKHVHERLPDPPPGRVPPQVLQVIRKAAAKDPAARWPSASAFVDALEAANASGMEPRSPTRRRVVAAGALLVAVWAGWFVARTPQQPLPPRPVDALGETTIQTLAPAPATRSQEKPEGAAPANAPVTPELPSGAKPAPASNRLPAHVTSPAIAEVPLGTVIIPSTDIARPATAVDEPPRGGGADVGINNPPTASLPRGAGPDIVTAPIRVRTVTADYPLAARAAQLEGDVVLQAVVGADGRVGGVSVVRSAHPLLDDAAKKAVLNYRYTPAQRNGVPEPATIRITVSFKMR